MVDWGWMGAFASCCAALDVGGHIVCLVVDSYYRTAHFHFDWA